MKATDRAKFAKKIAKQFNVKHKGALVYKTLEQNGLQLLIGVYFDSSFLPDKVESYYLIVPLYEYSDNIYFTGSFNTILVNTTKPLLFSLADLDSFVDVIGRFCSDLFNNHRNITDIWHLINDNNNLINAAGREFRLCEMGYIALGAGLYEEALDLLFSSVKLRTIYPTGTKKRRIYDDLIMIIELLKENKFLELHRLLQAWQQHTILNLKI